MIPLKKVINVTTGEIAAVRIGEEVTLKHVYLHDNFIELRPENPAFESIILTKEEDEYGCDRGQGRWALQRYLKKQEEQLWAF